MIALRCISCRFGHRYPHQKIARSILYILQLLTKCVDEYVTHLAFRLKSGRRGRIKCTVLSRDTWNTAAWNRLLRQNTSAPSTNEQERPRVLLIYAINIRDCCYQLSLIHWYWEKTVERTQLKENTIMQICNDVTNFTLKAHHRALIKFCSIIINWKKAIHKHLADIFLLIIFTNKFSYLRTRC